MSGLDPGGPFGLDKDERGSDKTSELERRVAALERGVGIVRVGAGPPPADALEPFYIDTTNHKAYGRDAAGYFILN